MSYSNSFETLNRAAYRPREHTRRAPMRRNVPLRPATRRASGLQLAGLAVLIACLAGACWFATSSLTRLIDGASQAGTPSNAHAGTPRSEWRAGEVPLMYQQDPAWSQARYAQDDFAKTGCGPTCMSMVYVALTGKDDMTPVNMAALSENMGCASADGTAWTFMTEGAAEAGLSVYEVPADEGSVRTALLSGNPVICSVGAGDFTSTGHFIVLTGIDKNGRLIVHDPNSPERSAKPWEFDVVLGQGRALWAYALA